MKFELSPDYQGGFTSGYVNRSFPVLCCSVKEVIHALAHYSTRQAYFVDIGRIVSHNVDKEDYLIEDGDTNFYIEYRRLYKVSRHNNVAMEALKPFPGDDIGEWHYFYDRENHASEKVFTVRDTERYIVGRVYSCPSVLLPQPQFSMNAKSRLYVVSGQLKISFEFTGTEKQLQRVLRQIRPDGATEEFMESLFAAIGGLGLNKLKTKYIHAARRSRQDVYYWRKFLLT